MSMTALPLTVGDVQNVQIGVGTFTDMAAAQLVVNGSNATPATTSLFAYANSLVSSAFSKPSAGNFAPVAISVDNLVLGGVPPAGALNAAGATTPNELQNLAINFSPPQAALANSLGLANPTIYVTEQMAQGLAAVGDTNLPGSAFVTKFGLSTTTPPTQAQVQAFAQAIFLETGSAASTTVQEANFWINYYTKNGVPPGVSTLPAWIAGLAAAAGDAIGSAIVGNSSGTNFSQQLVFNALVDNAEQIGGVKNADGTPVTYQVGKPLNAQQVPVPLQGQNPVPPTTVFLTQGADTPTTGFAKDANGTPLVPPGFTATVAGTVINALPFVTSLGLGNNTLNTGDNIVATGAAAGATTLVDVTANNPVPAANPAFATGITINGVNEVDITGNFPGLNGFTGVVNGVTTVKDINSVNTVQLGSINQGLNGALANVAITGYGGGNGTFIFDAVVNTAAMGLPTTIMASLGGAALGSTAFLGADILGFTAQGNPGTLANPNTAYPTWNLTINNPANLELTANTAFPAGSLGTPNVVGTTAIVLSGSSTALSTDAAGNWALLQSVDASKDTGNVFITGTSSSTDSAGGYFGTALSSSTNPFWAFGGANGLLEGNTVFNKFTGGGGVNLLDVSSLNPGQVAKLTASGNTTSQNQLVVTNAVANSTVGSALTFAGIANFQQLDVTGIAGTINLANMPAAMALNEIFYITPATGSVTILNQASLAGPLTVDVEDNASAQFAPPVGTPHALPGIAPTNLTVGALAALPATGQTLTVVIGDPLHNTAAFLATALAIGVPALPVPVPFSAGAGFLGNVTTFGDNTVTIMAQGQTQGGTVIWDFVNSVDVTPLVAASPMVTLAGNTNLFAAGVFSLDPTTTFIQMTGLTLIDTDTALTVLGDTEFAGLPTANSLSALSYSTSAQVLNASASGGLIMEGGDRAFTFSPTAAGSFGDLITGSATKGNVLNGSIGNDTITGNTTTFLPDTIVTSGGADKITVAAAHTANDVFAFYGGEFNAPFVPVPVNFGPGIDVPADIGSVVFGALNAAPAGKADTPELGWWAQGTGGTPTGYVGTTYAGFAANTGTTVANSDLTHITGFVAGPAVTPQDVLSFSVSSFGGKGGTNGDGGAVFGLTEGGHLTTPSAGTASGTTPFPAGGVVTVAQGSAATAATTIPAGNNAELIELTSGQFSDANALVASLSSTNLVLNPTSSIWVNSGPAAAGVNASFHLLIAYATPTAAVNIADLAVLVTSPLAANTTFALASATVVSPVNVVLHGSDIVQLTGIAPTDLHGGNLHLVA